MSQNGKSKSSPVKVLDYWIKQASKYVGTDKPFPSLSQFANAAFGDKIEKMGAKK